MTGRQGHSVSGKSLDIITFGETMALMDAGVPGPLTHVGSLGLGMGGAESNVAIGMKRLGASVAWAGRVGQDSLGDLIIRELHGEGLEVICRRDERSPTGLMIKERRTMDSVKVWYYRQGSAGSNFAPEDIPLERIAAAKLLHLTGITPALSESAAQAVQHAINYAKQAKTLISLDLNYRTCLWSRHDATNAFRNLIQQVDIVFASDDEAAIAVGSAESSRDLARLLAEMGPSQVIIKLGSAGSVALIDGVSYEQPAIPVRVVDSVGAGDAFVAGYLSELLCGTDANGRLLMAARTGAFACLMPGDWEGAPKRSELTLLETTDPVTR